MQRTNFGSRRDHELLSFVARSYIDPLFSLRDERGKMSIPRCGIKKHSNQCAQRNRTDQIDDNVRVFWRSIVETKRQSLTSLAFTQLVPGADLHSTCKTYYLFFSSWAGGIQQIRQSDWFLERAEFSNTDRYSGRNPSRWSFFVNELAVIVYLSPFLQFPRRLINTSLSLSFFRWQGKLL